MGVKVYLVWYGNFKECAGTETTWKLGDEHCAKKLLVPY